MTAAADLRTCKECNSPIIGRRPTAIYCSSKCNRRVVGRGWSAKRASRVTEPCSIDGCEKYSRSKGLCHRHYEYQRVYGRALPTIIVGDDKARLLSKINQSGPIPTYNKQLGPCWIWTGNVHPTTGYGHFVRKGVRTPLAHRASYELLVGPIPTGLQIDHLCMVKACVNPAHLEPVTPAENTRRARAASAIRRTS